MTSKKLLYNILKFSSENKYPDIHLNSGNFPMYRGHNWDIERVTSLSVEWKEKNVPKLSSEIVREFMFEIIWKNWFVTFN